MKTPVTELTHVPTGRTVKIRTMGPGISGSTLRRHMRKLGDVEISRYTVSEDGKPAEWVRLPYWQSYFKATPSP